MSPFEVEMKIKLVKVGKVKDIYLKEGINEYLKRITPYIDISLVEVKEESVNNPLDNSEIERCKKLEGDRLLKEVRGDRYIIALDLQKNEYTSEKFSDYLYSKLEEYNSVSFLIGGSYGLSDEVKSVVNDSISLSKFTFLHDMSTLIFLEQVYRASKIHHHEVYHK
ncbi:MAG: 23S rRNA (pseudouridine(1915)-N(3))-methyltransferase RlmH [Coprobacillus sp.]|nr:23S rRNA (pseudouridine(1915)-N(3))-methyltransferase RlmH [Coprobacillus sp.]